MENTQSHDQNDTSQPNHQQQPPPEPRGRVQNWDKSGGGRGLGIALIAIAALIGLFIVFSLMSKATAPASRDEATIAPSGILQRNVDAAFGDDRSGQTTNQPPSNAQQVQEQRAEDAGALPPTGGSNGNTPREETLEEAQARQLQEEQRVLEEREQMLQKQRDAVPSLLPENPPQPVKLGTY